MKIKQVISALQRYVQVNPEMEVAICFNVAEEGILAEDNFILEGIEDMNVILLIAPSDYRKAYKKAYSLWKAKQKENEDGI